MADLDFVVDSTAPYAISEPGTNMAIANLHAQYKNDGTVFMGVCLGFVDAVFYSNDTYLRKDLGRQLDLIDSNKYSGATAEARHQWGEVWKVCT